MEDEEDFVKRPLTGKDYIQVPWVVLSQHPDYTNHAMRVVVAVLDMNTAQLEELTIARGPH